MKLHKFGEKTKADNPLILFVFIRVHSWPIAEFRCYQKADKIRQAS